MTDRDKPSHAPERIWAGDAETCGAITQGTWRDTVRGLDRPVEYVRADHYDAMECERDALAEARERIEQWSEAYPLSTFPEPDLSQVRSVLSAAGFSLDTVAASNMRHVISGVVKIARAALRALAGERG